MARVTRLAFQLARSAAQARHAGRQGEHPRHLAPVARGHARDRGRVSRRHVRGRAGRCDGDASAAPAARLRRGGDREHVRRHPHRRGLGAHRLARHAAVGVARRGAQPPRRARRPLRADPRQRAGHRRPRPRQPARRDPLRRAAARVLARPAGGRRAPSRPRSAACSTPGCAPPTCGRTAARWSAARRWARRCDASWSRAPP